MRDAFIESGEDLLQVLDALLAEHGGGTWWDGFYADRAKPIPFFVEHPDESLVELLTRTGAGRALDLGCGHGRNSIFLSSQVTCFAPEGGSGLTDLQVYERRSTGYGLGYTDAQLRQLWSREFDVQLLRRMVKPPTGSGLFGETFLWVLFAQKRHHGDSARQGPGRS
jgi:hypothetical protein